MTESLITEVESESEEEDKVILTKDKTVSKVTRTPKQASEFTPGRTTEEGVPVLLPVDLTLTRDDGIDPKELSPMQMIK